MQELRFVPDCLTNSEIANVDIFKGILFLKNGYKILFILDLSLRNILNYYTVSQIPRSVDGQFGRILRKEKSSKNF